jgi:hypothetical protein
MYLAVIARVSRSLHVMLTPDCRYDCPIYIIEDTSRMPTTRDENRT